MPIAEPLNLSYIEAQYERWRRDSQSVSPDWRLFFQGFDLGMSRSAPSVTATGAAALPADECTPDRALRQARVEALKHRYRDLGHLLACLDPLSACPTSHPLLELSAVGLSPEDLTEEFHAEGPSGPRTATLADILRELRETYCRSVGVEYQHLQDPDERRWLRDRMEPCRNRPDLSAADRDRILAKLLQANLFEAFLNKKYIGQTRFSLEGAETLIPMLDALLLAASGAGATEVILGMAHRGRLNVLTNVLYKPYEEIFREFVNSYDPDTLVGAGDVKYHNGHIGDITLAEGRPLKIFLVNNPSHLESVNPVVEGIARARQEMAGPDGTRKVLPVLVHGDAAFAGQGVVFETLNLSQLPGYRTGGTVHVVINNQIGYTTLPENARSTRYSTDVAKILMAPVFHVHGEDPEAAVHVMRLAHDYRAAFGKDVVVDLVCYRRFGHNEGDEPYFTQPLMYDRIRERPPVNEPYAAKLLEEGVVTPERVEILTSGMNQCLEEAFEAARTNPRRFPEPVYYDEWKGYHGRFSEQGPATAVSAGILTDLCRRITTPPEGFTPHPTVKRVLERRRESVETGVGIDWATAESLAFATLLSEGRFVRLSGQDSGRGTFSQRHAVLFDRKTGESHVPLAELGPAGAAFSVINSSLSETGVMGFDYGYSIVRPDGLTIWEAQFGDFANNAQSVIDLYIASGETKWRRLSGLVLLLPHGWEGLGPEHSSARPERFLQLCAHENMQVCDLTTPAQFFHLLRQQVLASWRKPLVVLAPKSLLRNPAAVSSLADFTQGEFQPVIPDGPEIEKPRRVIFCSGKIFYQLRERRDTLKVTDIAIVRVERMYPFPEAGIANVAARYAGAREWLWVQEAPENMGAWRFMEPRLRRVVGREIQYVGRAESASPATGFANLYKQEQAAIPDRAVGQISGVQAG